MGEVVVVMGRMSIFKVFPKGQTYVVRAHSQSQLCSFSVALRHSCMGVRQGFFQIPNVCTQ